jgi:hypothetical protein
LAFFLSSSSCFFFVFSSPLRFFLLFPDEDDDELELELDEDEEEDEEELDRRLGGCLDTDGALDGAVEAGAEKDLFLSFSSDEELAARSCFDFFG